MIEAVTTKCDCSPINAHHCSGHGLSGMALLSLPAFLAVPSMFAGGMGLAAIQRLLS